ncbi:dienelactone hydrolase family protein [Planctomycetota bacterium]
MRRLLIGVMLSFLSILVGACEHRSTRSASYDDSKLPAPRRADQHLLGDSLIRLWCRAQTVTNEKALLENASEKMPEFFVIRDAVNFLAFKERFPIDNFYVDSPPDFDSEMIVGAIDIKAKRSRRFRIYRIVDLPDNVEVQVISYGGRKPIKKELSPYLFHKVPRIDKPLHFFYNNVLVWIENPQPLEAGLHNLVRPKYTLYSVFIPEKIEKPAPLIVYLHGSTTTAARNGKKFHDMAEKYGFIVLATCARNGYYWQEDVDFEPIFNILGEVSARFPVDPNRIYLGGGSAGGHTSYTFASKYRHVFAGFFAISGRLNPRTTDEEVAKLKDMPVFILYGSQDALVASDPVYKGKARLDKAGAKVTLRVVEDAGHNVTKNRPDLIQEIFEWLSQLAYGTPKPVSERQ